MAAGREENTKTDAVTSSHTLNALSPRRFTEGATWRDTALPSPRLKTTYIKRPRTMEELPALRQRSARSVDRLQTPDGSRS